MFDITKKSVLETAEVELLNGDDSPLCDDEGKRLSVTVCGPGSKVWQQADAERRRKATARVEKNKGKLTAALDASGDDETEFLLAITVSFNGWEYPNPDGKKWVSQRDMFRAAYEDHTIGFIRKQVADASGDWSAFTKGSQRT
jgi:hypothetical protein